MNCYSGAASSVRIEVQIDYLGPRIIPLIQGKD